MTRDQLEGVAAETLASVSAALPIDAFQVAALYGLDLTPVSRCEEGFDGQHVSFNEHAPDRAQHEYVARCLAKRALQDHGYFVTEHATARLARALLLPMDALMCDLEAGMDIAELRTRHAHAPTAMIGARVADLYAANRSLTG